MARIMQTEKTQERQVEVAWLPAHLPEKMGCGEGPAFIPPATRNLETVTRGSAETTDPVPLARSVKDPSGDRQEPVVFHNTLIFRCHAPRSLNLSIGGVSGRIAHFEGRIWMSDTSGRYGYELRTPEELTQVRRHLETGLRDPANGGKPYNANMARELIAEIDKRFGAPPPPFPKPDGDPPQPAFRLTVDNPDATHEALRRWDVRLSGNVLISGTLQVPLQGDAVNEYNRETRIGIREDGRTLSIHAVERDGDVKNYLLDLATFQLSERN